MKLSASCSTFNFEQNDILFLHLDQIFIMYSIPEGNSVTLTKKIARKSIMSISALAKGTD